MCLAAFQAFWGKAYKYFPLKSVFIACITIFEIGSLVVAVAPSSTAIIVGRAIQGAGGSGITGGCYIILAFITEPKHLHKVMGISSTVWSCSSVLGPVLGGLFTQNVSWRWCFYVNLPIGGTAVAIILLCFKTPSHSRVGHAKLKEIPLLFDMGGTIIVLAALTCLLLVLQDGGVTYPWSNSVPIGLLVGFILITIVFIFLEWKQGDRAMIVFRIIKRRTIWTLAVFSVCAQASGFARNYNLPIFFQAVQGVSPTESGIRTLPTVLTICKLSFLHWSYNPRPSLITLWNSSFQFRRLPPYRQSWLLPSISLGWRHLLHHWRRPGLHPRTEFQSSCVYWLPSLGIDRFRLGRPATRYRCTSHLSASRHVNYHCHYSL
jgi:MFS family permease